MNLLRTLSLLTARSWDRLATQARLRELPAVPTVAAVLALGIGIPLFAEVKTTPPALTRSLAVQRLESFYARIATSERGISPAGVTLDARPDLAWKPIEGARTYAVALLGASERVVFRASRLEATTCPLPENVSLEPGSYRIQVTGRDPAGNEVERRAGQFEVIAAIPVGELMTARPIFRWLPVPGAARYRVRLMNGDGLVVATKETTAPAFAIRAPANLPPAEYHFEALGIGAKGEDLPYPRAAVFTVRAASQEAAKLSEAAQLELDGVASDLATAGYYAEKGSRYDVLAALEPFLRGAAAGDAGTDVARRIFALHGVN